MNVELITGKDGVVTVHKDTCKKIEGRETQGLEDLLDLNPGALTTAKKASCCKPSDAIMGEIEQAGWDTLEAIANAPEAEAVHAATDITADEDEDLIGDVQQNDDGITAEDEEDLIGTPAPAAKGKAATKVSKDREAAKELNGSESLKKVADHLGLELGAKPVFPGFGKAFKTAAKQSVYVNSKGNADVRATDAAQADAWAALEHVERRAGNYVRVALAAL